MDDKNIGFRQYKLPFDVCLKQNIVVKGEEDSNFPARYAVDGKTTTYCKILGEEKSSERELIITFDKPYKCNYFKIIFNNLIERVNVYDYSQETNILLYQEENHTTPFKEIKNYLNRTISAVKITSLEPYNIEEGAQIIEVQFFSNVIESPEGYFIRDVEIQSQPFDEEAM